MEKIKRYNLVKASTRGVSNHGWLKSAHSFSFANYYDPERIHFGALRVLNDDFVAKAEGFGKHPHDNMEIISIPLSGELKHSDSMGNTTIIKEGEVQVMSAGTGIIHSEMNNRDDIAVEFLQIWVFPNKKNVEPRYGQIEIGKEAVHNKLGLIVAFLIEGVAHIDGHVLNKRDALAVLDAQDIDIKVTENTKILVMEVPLTW